MAAPPTISLLLNLIDTNPTLILTHLASHPSLAHASDSHGYTLLHAASSYSQIPVLQTLIHTYAVDPNTLDEDGETALFVAEKEEVARWLVENGVDWRKRNEEGVAAEERIKEEEGENDVVSYLRGLRVASVTETDGSANGTTAAESVNGHTSPGPLPQGMKIEVGTMEEDAAAPDPEIRRRIEELAAREDYASPEVQVQLRELVQDVVQGLGREEEDGRRSVRRRVD